MAGYCIAYILRAHGEDWTQTHEQQETFWAEKHHDYLQFHTNYPEFVACCFGKLLIEFFIILVWSDFWIFYAPSSQSTHVKFWKYSYNFDCQPVDYSDSEFGQHEVDFTYGYLILKLLDWFDTLFIILKKKDSQLSFLHTYHHSIVFAATYFACKLKLMLCQ